MVFCKMTEVMVVVPGEKVEAGLAQSVERNGCKLEPDTWIEFDTGKFATPNNGIEDSHFWGWHTSPENNGPDEFGMMNHLLMPDDTTWDYPMDGWQPIPPVHRSPNDVRGDLDDIAFELYTIPEPASLALLSFGGLLMIRRKTS